MFRSLFLIVNIRSINLEQGDYKGQFDREGAMEVYYTSPQSFMITFSYRLAQQLWGLLLNLDMFVCSVECPNVSTT